MTSFFGRPFFLLGAVDMGAIGAPRLCRAMAYSWFLELSLYVSSSFSARIMNDVLQSAVELHSHQNWPSFCSNCLSARVLRVFCQLHHTSGPHYAFRLSEQCHLNPRTLPLRPLPLLPSPSGPLYQRWNLLIGIILRHPQNLRPLRNRTPRSNQTQNSTKRSAFGRAISPIWTLTAS